MINFANLFRLDPYNSVLLLALLHKTYDAQSALAVDHSHGQILQPRTSSTDEGQNPENDSSMYALLRLH